MYSHGHLNTERKWPPYSFLLKGEGIFGGSTSACSPSVLAHSWVKGQWCLTRSWPSPANLLTSSCHSEAQLECSFFSETFPYFPCHTWALSSMLSCHLVCNSTITLSKICLICVMFSTKLCFLMKFSFLQAQEYAWKEVLHEYILNWIKMD